MERGSLFLVMQGNINVCLGSPFLLESAACIRNPSAYYVSLILRPVVYGEIWPDIAHIRPDIIHIRPDVVVIFLE